MTRGKAFLCHPFVLATGRLPLGTLVPYLSRTMDTLRQLKPRTARTVVAKPRSRRHSACQLPNVCNGRVSWLKQHSATLQHDVIDGQSSTVPSQRACRQNPTATPLRTPSSRKRGRQASECPRAGCQPVRCRIGRKACYWAMVRGPLPRACLQRPRSARTRSSPQSRRRSAACGRRGAMRRAPLPPHSRPPSPIPRSSFRVGDTPARGPVGR